MKKTIFLLLLTYTCFITSCVNHSEEPKIDCSAANLGLEVESSVKSGCQNAGSVTVIAEGGLEPYTYSSNNVSYQESNKLEGLFAGNLELYVKDANGCVLLIAFNLEAENNSVSMNVSSTKSDCINDTGTITATATGGAGDYTYSLDGSSTNSTGMFTNVSAGSHQVAVADSEGCEVSNSISVDSESNVSLSADIVPIVSANCAISGCHNGSVSPNLSTSTAIRSNASNIKTRTGNRSMPQGRTLTNLQIDQIACWVDAGAKDN